MSLREVYTLAHHAQARLDRESRRSDRSLRFLVGHLAHCESLRLRIDGMENAIAQSRHASAVSFKGTGPVVDYTFQHAGRRSPPPPATLYADNEDVDDDIFDDDDEEISSLGLMRCASRSPCSFSQPDLHLEDAVEDDGDSDSDSDAISPPELDFEDSDQSDEDSESECDSDNDDQVSIASPQSDNLSARFHNTFSQAKSTATFPRQTWQCSHPMDATEANAMVQVGA